MGGTCSNDCCCAFTSGAQDRSGGGNGAGPVDPGNVDGEDFSFGAGTANPERRGGRVDNGDDACRDGGRYDDGNSGEGSNDDDNGGNGKDLRAQSDDWSQDEIVSCTGSILLLKSSLTSA